MCTHYREGSSLTASVTTQLWKGQAQYYRARLLGFYWKDTEKLFWSQPGLSMPSSGNSSAAGTTLVAMYSELGSRALVTLQVYHKAKGAAVIKGTFKVNVFSFVSFKRKKCEQFLFSSYTGGKCYCFKKVHQTCLCRYLWIYCYRIIFLSNEGKFCSHYQ